MNANDISAYATVGAALVALVLGIISVVVASRAKKESARANQIAIEANKISENSNKLVDEANGVIREEAARKNERTDVEWEWRWDAALQDHVVIQNIGKTLATKVVAQFWFGDVREANDASPVDVDGQHEIKFQIPELGEARRVAANVFEVARISGELPISLRARTRLRVMWETPLGNIGRHDSNYQETDLVAPNDNMNKLIFWGTD